MMLLSPELIHRLCFQVCETQVRSVSLELLWSLQEVDNRLNILKDRMEHLEHVSLQVNLNTWIF